MAQDINTANDTDFVVRVIEQKCRNGTQLSELISCKRFHVICCEWGRSTNDKFNCINVNVIEKEKRNKSQHKEGLKNKSTCSYRNSTQWHQQQYKYQRFMTCNKINKNVVRCDKEKNNDEKWNYERNEIFFVDFKVMSTVWKWSHLTWTNRSVDTIFISVLKIKTKNVSLGIAVQ